MVKNIQVKQSAKAMLQNVLNGLPEAERNRFGQDLRVRFDEIITGYEVREYKILPADILAVLREGNYQLTKSLV